MIALKSVMNTKIFYSDINKNILQYINTLYLKAGLPIGPDLASTAPVWGACPGIPLEI